jgi:uncharacterized linocin/CFP29 family protein
MGLPPVMDGSVGNGSLPPVGSGSLPPLPLPDVLNLGRERLPEWTPAIWSRIDDAAMGEIDQASVAAQFLPRVPSVNPSARTVPANIIETVAGELNVNQTNVLALLEESQLFFLSKEQYYEERAIATAAALATRSANRLARQMDTRIFNGFAVAGVMKNPGLITVAATEHTEPVDPLAAGRPGVYGEKLFAAVAAAYSHLQGLSLYGPYALVLPPAKFADAHAPLKSTLIMPADRIRPLMTAGFYASGTLPADQGVMVSLGGTVDLAIAVHGATAFTLVNPDETRRFRIYERFSVRIKVPESLVLLQFN